MNDVADRLNITKPALYHYFNNKEDILLECYRLGVGLIEEILNEVADCGNGLQKVEAFIRSYAGVMTVNFGRCVMRLDEGDLTSDARAEVRIYLAIVGGQTIRGAQCLWPAISICSTNSISYD